MRALCVFFLAVIPLGSLEIKQGYVSLVIHEETGGFSFNGQNGRGYDPFLADKSRIEVTVNDRIYRLDSPAFSRRLELDNNTAVMIFESETLRLRQEFAFIQTADSPQANGLRMTVRLTNLLARQINVGARVMLDIPQVRSRGIPLFINNREIGSETVIDGSVSYHWASRGPLFLMGSIGAVSAINPDYLHIGDWNQLNEAAWISGKGWYADSRINVINAPVVCYNYNPRSIPANGEISYSILLAAEDPAGFGNFQLSTGVPSVSSEGNSKSGDLLILDSLMRLINRHLSREIEISYDELDYMEQVIRRIKIRHRID